MVIQLIFLLMMGFELAAMGSGNNLMSSVERECPPMNTVAANDIEDDRFRPSGLKVRLNYRYLQPTGRIVHRQDDEGRIHGHRYWEYRIVTRVFEKNMTRNTPDEIRWARQDIKGQVTEFIRSYSHLDQCPRPGAAPGANPRGGGAQ